MDDLISRQAAIDMLVEDKIQTKIYITSTAERDFEVFNGACDRHAKMLKELPSAQPELPKQFMSDDCISRSELYKKVCEAEKLARERVLDTPSDSPFPNKLNPAYTRYSAQLDERTQFKHMIADARSVQPEIIRCKDCRHYLCPHGCGHIDGMATSQKDGFCSYAERREEQE